MNILKHFILWLTNPQYIQAKKQGKKWRKELDNLATGKTKIEYVGDPRLDPKNQNPNIPRYCEKDEKGNLLVYELDENGKKKYIDK